MRGHYLTSDMDFRVIPSAMPLQSPSPDHKSVNIITPTISPNAVQIKKGSTPNKSSRKFEKQNRKYMQQADTELKYHSHSSGAQYTNILRQKDEIISYLRQIINVVTENSRHKRMNEEEEEDLKKQVRILTIENQQLVSIIDKLNNNKSMGQKNAKLEQYQARIKELSKTIKQNQTFYEQQTKQLKKFNKSLNIQLKNLQNQKNQLLSQNKKLLKILTEKNEAQKNNEKLKLSDASSQEHSNQQKHTGSKSQQRLTLMKIRQQHSENLKMLKEGLIKEIQETFDTMKIALQGIGIKVNGLSQRLQSIEKMTWARVRKAHVQTESITISIRQGQQRQQNQEETDRSYVPQKKNNSQIYIEEGPASSHERASRDEFSRLEQVQIHSQKNYNNVLQQQLGAVKNELLELKFKYEKLCMETSKINISQQNATKQSVQISKQYRQVLDQIKKKDKQIGILYDQIKAIEQQKIGQLDRREKQWRIQVQRIEESHKKQIDELRSEIELNVGILKENYEKEIQILKRQSFGNKKFQEFSTKNNVFQAQNKELKEKVRKLYQEMNLAQEDWQKVKRTLEKGIQTFQQDYENERKRREQIEQEAVLKLSQLSQGKAQIQLLKEETSLKNQQIFRMKEEIQKWAEKNQKYEQQIKKLMAALTESQNTVAKLSQILSQHNNISILQQINELKTLVEQNKSNIDEQNMKLEEEKQRKEEQLEEISKLRYENLSLRKQLDQKDALHVQLLAKIKQLQNLYQFTKQKLEQKQKIYEQVIGKIGQLQKSITDLRIQKEELLIKQGNSLDTSLLLIKIQGLRNFQQQRLLTIKNGLEWTKIE